jgi:hypothetical protein
VDGVLILGLVAVTSGAASNVFTAASVQAQPHGRKVVVTADPDDAAAPREQYAEITPGDHPGGPGTAWVIGCGGGQSQVVPLSVNAVGAALEAL